MPRYWLRSIIEYWKTIERHVFDTFLDIASPRRSLAYHCDHEPWTSKIMTNLLNSGVEEADKIVEFHQTSVNFWNLQKKLGTCFPWHPRAGKPLSTNVICFYLSELYKKKWCRGYLPQLSCIEVWWQGESSANVTTGKNSETFTLHRLIMAQESWPICGIPPNCWFS